MSSKRRSWSSMCLGKREQVSWVVWSRQNTSGDECAAGIGQEAACWRQHSEQGAVLRRPLPTELWQL